MMGDQPSGRPEGRGRTARPGRECGILHEVGPDRVPIQVPERGQRIGVFLDETGMIPPLPDVAPPGPRLVERLGGFGHEPAEGPSECVQLGRLEEQVHVIRHQRVGIRGFWFIAHG
jgi:hypothetical protein